MNEWQDALTEILSSIYSTPHAASSEIKSHESTATWLRAHGELEDFREGPWLGPCLLHLSFTSNTDSYLNLWTPWLVVGGQDVESTAVDTVVRLGEC